MSASDEWVLALLMSLGHMLPMLMVWLTGLVIALVRWPRCPAVSLLVVVATVVAGMTSIATQAFYMILPRYWDTADFARFAGVIGLVSSFMHACAWGSLLAAAFLGRAAGQSDALANPVTKSPI